MKNVPKIRIFRGGGYENPSQEKNEKCVLCGRDVGIPESVPIENRKYYVCGCGQLCGACYKMLENEWKYLE